MSTSAPVAIPISKSRRQRDERHSPRHSDSRLSSSVSPFLDEGSSGFDFSASLSTPSSITPCGCCSKSYASLQSATKTQIKQVHPITSSPLTMSRSSSSDSSLSLSSSPYTSPSLRLSRALSPPREQVTFDDPLRSLEDTDESDESETDVSISKSPTPVAEDYSKEFLPSKKPPRRKSQFKSSLTASLIALKDKIPSSLSAPTIYTPPLLHPISRVEVYTRTTVRNSLSSSLPVFEIPDHEEPPSSAVQLQTYSVSLGPPRKPREARMNSDFLRLLALEMEMRRSGKFGPLTDTDAQGNSGICVSGKVRMILPRRCDREREDVNMSTFNKSRLKW